MSYLRAEVLSLLRWPPCLVWNEVHCRPGNVRWLNWAEPAETLEQGLENRIGSHRLVLISWIDNYFVSHRHLTAIPHVVVVDSLPLCRRPSKLASSRSAQAATLTWPSRRARIWRSSKELRITCGSSGSRCSTPRRPDTSRSPPPHRTGSWRRRYGAPATLIGLCMLFWQLTQQLAMCVCMPLLGVGTTYEQTGFKSEPAMPLAECLGFGWTSSLAVCASLPHCC